MFYITKCYFIEVVNIIFKIILIFLLTILYSIVLILLKSLGSMPSITIYWVNNQNN